MNNIVRLFFPLVCFCLFVISPKATKASDLNGRDDLIVRTESGMIRGKYVIAATSYISSFSAGLHNANASTTLCKAFLGIPYAAPPTNDLRFERPQVHPRWDGIKDAVSWGNSCPQVLSSDTFFQGFFFPPLLMKTFKSLSSKAWFPKPARTKIAFI